MQESNEAFIEFKNVTKMFDTFKALDNINLSIPQGCFMTLLGPSGCGKTTLMRQLSGFSEPDSGDLFIKGKRVNGLPPYKRNTPLVFQEYALFPHMTVEENITYGLKLKNTDKETLTKRLDDMLKMFNLIGLEKRFPKQLSGGQQQRVAFARALIMGQEVLLLDEPLSNLDAKLRVEVRSELRQIQKKLGITTIYVTHDQDEALSMSDLIAVMRAGKIEQIGTPWQIYFKPENRFVADFVGTVNFLDGEIINSTKDRICINWQGNVLSMSRSCYEFQNGESVSLVVRPECISLKPAQDDALDTADSLRGKITFFSFLPVVL
jgi:ABC-type Fe3+/spermidine/putrescine transport system ATPase subunit